MDTSNIFENMQPSGGGMETARGDGSQTSAVIGNYAGAFGSILGGVLNPVKNLLSKETTTEIKEAEKPKDSTGTILIVVGAIVVLAVVGFLMFRK
jgi:hypothetical protein